jgi:hypothetical protein
MEQSPWEANRSSASQNLTCHNHLTFSLTICSNRSIVFLHFDTFHYVQTGSLTLLGGHRPERFVKPQLEEFSTVDLDNYAQKCGRESLLPQPMQVFTLTKPYIWDLCLGYCPVSRCFPVFPYPEWPHLNEVLVGNKLSVMECNIPEE